jgi:hypothetical protein
MADCQEHFAGKRKAMYLPMNPRDYPYLCDGASTQRRAYPRPIQIMRGIVAKSFPFPFMATCPKSKDLRSQAAHGCRVLIQLLDEDQPIEARCNVCGDVWTVSDPDRARLAKDVAIVR